MIYSELLTEVDKGIAGENTGIPLCLPKLGGVINGIQKRTYHLIGGNIGTGKTSFVDYAYVLKVFDWWLVNRDKTNIKVRWIYRSMERNKIYKLAKWTCVKLEEVYKIRMDVPELLGWSANSRASEYRTEIDSFIPYFDELLSYMDLIDGAENPTGIYNQVVHYANNHGEVIQESEFVRKYIEKDPDLITIVILDHVGKLKKERGFSKKETIDKMSEYCNIFRDFYGFNPIGISQFNRDIGDTLRFKLKELNPQLEDFKDSGSTAEDADIVIALFNPARYKVLDHMGYDVKRFIHNGKNRFRSLSVLKNSYGMDDVRVAAHFLGESGIFTELPTAEQLLLNQTLYNDFL